MTDQDFYFLPVVRIGDTNSFQMKIITSKADNQKCEMTVS